MSGGPRKTITPQLVEVATRYVSGDTAKAVAARFGLSEEAVKTCLRDLRALLRSRGHRDVSNVISLRAALRAEGLIEELELI